MEVVNKAINMKSFVSDPKLDDKYINAEDGEEVGPPSQDNIGRGRKLNDPSVVNYFAAKTAEVTLSDLGGKFSPLGKNLMPAGGRNSGLSARSGASRTSKVSAQQSTVDGAKSRNKSEATAAPRRKAKRSDSEKKQAMEKRLLAYYQSLVQPVQSWDPVYGEQQMLDGTDVDAQINKKRAHKNIMAEAFSPNKANRFKFTKKTQKREKKTSQETATGTGTSEPPDSGYEYLKCYDNDQNGYILEDGNIIAIDQPSLDALNKYAYDVIKAQVTDHIEKLEEGQEANFEKLKGDFMNVIEKNQMTKARDSGERLSISKKETTQSVLNQQEKSEEKVQERKPPVRRKTTKVLVTAAVNEDDQ